MADVFPYYAGFSFDWAEQRLTTAALRTEHIVLDPWNGSGTTTLAASTNGLRSIGIDLNPVANIVARFRANATAGELVGLPAVGSRAAGGDPLLAWFVPSTSARIRQWAAEAAFSRTGSDLGLVALFRVVRNLTESFQGSNPTWVRRTSPDRPPVEIPRKDLDALIVSEQRSLCERLKGTECASGPMTILSASSKRLPLADESVDFVLTSPPYLTRIDYAVAYARELAVLGVNIEADRNLRETLMGTTLIRPQDPRVTTRLGPIAKTLIEQIGSHNSHASGGYYLKQAFQYLDDLTLSLSEITRVAKDAAHAVLVVQDSYYKDIPVPLADICEQEANLRGWRTIAKEPYPVVRTLTSLNRSAREYPKGPVAETVLTLRRRRV